MSLRHKLRRLRRLLFMDPVYKCRRYNTVGCAHVDGLLCDFPVCSMRKTVD